MTEYRLVTQDEAEFAVLPQYLERLDSADFRAFVSKAEAAGLRTLVFAGGDIEPLMPDESIVLLHPGPTRGAQPRATSMALPFMLTDRAGPNVGRVDGERPSVAFCGQGAQARSAQLAHGFSRLRRRALHAVKPVDVPPPLRGHVRLRADALRRLARHDGIDDHFIVRDRYRAGVVSDEDRERTQREFDANLRSSTYALCVRGTGNFSARFYEALSFGRMPLLVNTDCILPFEDEIDWRQHTVWVEADEIGSIAEVLLSAHREFRHDQPRSAPALRSLWDERLSEHGYFGHLPTALRRLGEGVGLS